MDDAGMRRVFTESEFEELVQSVRTELLPKLADVRRNVQQP